MPGMTDQDNVVLHAKLALDTSDAEGALNSLANKAKQQTSQSQAGAKVKVPTQPLKDVHGVVSKLPRVIRGVTQGVNGLSTSMMSLRGKLGIVAAILAVISKLLKGTDSTRKIADQFERLFDMLRNALAPVLAVIADLIGIIVESLEPLLPVLEFFSILLSFLLMQLGGIVEMLSPLNMFLGVLFQDLMNLMGINKDTILSRTETKGELTEGMKTSLDTWETSTTGSYLSRIADNTHSYLDKLGPIGTAMAWIKEKLEIYELAKITMFRAIPSLFTKAVKAIGDAFKNVGKDLKEKFEAVGQVFKGVGEKLKESFSELGRKIKEFFTWLWTQIKGFFGKAGDFFSGVGDSFKSGWEKTKDVFKGLGSRIKGVFTFAGGGTLDVGAQVWGMNEPGNPEFLFNAGGHDTVINRQILSDALYDALTRADRSSGKQQLEVKVASGAPAGPRELAQWLLPYMRFLISRGG